MKKIKRVGFMLLAAVALMSFAGCKDKADAEHPAKDGAAKPLDHPAH
jgi:hypothetical protein